MFFFVFSFFSKSRSFWRRLCISFLFSAFNDTHKSRRVHNFFSAFLFCMSFLTSNSNYFAVVDIAEKEPSKVSSQQQQAASSVSWLQARVSVPVSLPARHRDRDIAPLTPFRVYKEFILKENIFVSFFSMSIKSLS